MSLDLNLGIDFGTSFTKVCVRDTARENSWIIMFNDSQSLEDALLPTRIGICHDGTVLSGLTQSEWEQHSTSEYTAIDFIKMRLANLYLRLDQEGWQFPCHLEQSISGVDLDNAETIENLCAYYLSGVISRAKAWIMQHNANLVRNQKIDWSMNIGVPVQYADSGAIAGFQKVLHLGWLLSEAHPTQITVNQLNARLHTLRQQLPHHSDLFCSAIPEVAAAVYSYTVSRQAKPGTYIFFDIGSGTIEGASFNFWYENEMPRIDFYVGEVQPLGVHAVIKQIAGTIGSPESESELDSALLRDDLLTNISDFSEQLRRQHRLKRGDFVANRWQISERSIQEELQSNWIAEKRRTLYFILKQRDIHRQVAKVIMQTKAKNPAYYSSSARLPIFIGGGGSAIQFYPSTISDTFHAFNHRYAGVPSYYARNFPIPADLNEQITQQQFHRFAVAYGLSIPEYGMPEVRLPRLFPEQSVLQCVLNLGSSTDGEYIISV